MAVEGKPISNLSAADVRDLVLGEPGSFCALTILPGKSQKFESELPTIESEDEVRKTEASPKIKPAPAPKAVSDDNVNIVPAISPPPTAAGAGLPPRPRGAGRGRGRGAEGGAGGERRGNRGINRAGPSKPVEIRLMLDLHYDQAGQEGSHTRQMFEHSLCKDLSYASGLPLKLFKIKQIIPASTIVDVEIFPLPSGECLAPDDVANDLVRQVGESTSPLMMGALTCHTLNILVIPKSNKITPVIAVPPLSPHQPLANAAAPGTEQNRKPAEIKPADQVSSSQDNGSHDESEGKLSAIMVPGPHTPRDTAVLTPPTPRCDEEAHEEGEWVLQWSSSKRRSYYYNTATGESAWKPRKQTKSPRHILKPNLEAQWLSEDSEEDEQRPAMARIRSSKKKGLPSRNQSPKHPSDDIVSGASEVVVARGMEVDASRHLKTIGGVESGPVARMPLEFITGSSPVGSGAGAAASQTFHDNQVRFGVWYARMHVCCACEG